MHVRPQARIFELGAHFGLTEIRDQWSSSQNGCFTQKVPWFLHVRFMTFYPFESFERHSQAMRQSLWKKRIGFQRLARLHLRVLVSLIPEIGASSTDLPGPIEMAMGKSSGLHLTVTEKMTKSNCQNLEIKKIVIWDHLRSWSATIIYYHHCITTTSNYI